MSHSLCESCRCHILYVKVVVGLSQICTLRIICRFWYCDMPNRVGSGRWRLSTAAAQRTNCNTRHDAKERQTKSQLASCPRNDTDLGPIIITMPSKANSAASSRQHQHKEPEANLHTRTLGSDGNDFSDIPIGGDVASTKDTSSTSQQPKLPSSNNKEGVSNNASGNVRKRNNRRLPGSNPSSPLRQVSDSYRPPADLSTGSPAGLEMPLHHAPSSPARNTIVQRSDESSNSKPSWWGQMWGVKRSASEEVHDYRSFGSPYDGPGAGNNEGGLQHARQLQNQDPLAATSTSSVPATATDNPSQIEPHNPSVEDQLRQNCTFFFDEEAQGSNNRRQAIARRINPRRRIRPMHAVSTPIFSTQDGAKFHAKYEQLNQVLERSNHASGVDILDNDLHLSIDDEHPIPQRQPFGGENGAISFHSTVSHNVTNVKNSSLCYEQHGRLLMRLPRDQVRLIMDTELQPGIVSVEQWRKEGEPHRDSTVRGDGAVRSTSAPSSPTPYLVDETTSERSEQQKDVEAVPSRPVNGKNATSDPDEHASFFETTPPLRYVITVPDDLYRRVVSEMNDSLTSPFFGMGQCREDEHADIRIAIAIISVILILLFIGTMDWEFE